MDNNPFLQEAEAGEFQTGNEDHPISPLHRMAVSALATTPEAGISYLKKNYPDYKFGHDQDGNIFFKTDKDAAPQPLNPKGLNISDIAGAVPKAIEGVAQGVGGAYGGPIGAGAATAGVEGLKQMLGSSLGMEDNINLTSIAANGAAAAILPKALSKLGEGAQFLGKKIYMSSPLMQTLAQKLERNVPEVLFKNGIYGTNKSISNQAGDLANNIDQSIGAMGDKIDASGATANYSRAKAGFDSKLNALKGSEVVPVMEHASQIEAQNIPDKYLPFNVRGELTTQVPKEIPFDERFPEMGTKTVMEDQTTPGYEGQNFSKLMEQKRAAYNKVPENAWGTSGYNAEREGWKMMGHQLKNETENMAGEALGPDAAKELGAKNVDWGALIDAKDLLDQQAMKTVNKKLGGAVTGMAAGTGNPLILGGKLAGDLVTSSLGRTASGMGLNNLGKFTSENPNVIAPLLQQIRKSKGDNNQ